MTEPVTFISLNVCGLSSPEKRKDVLNFLKQKRYSIYFLQDTHFIKKEENYIRTQWGFECFFSSFNSQSRGVAILFNNNFEYTLHKVHPDEAGNRLIIEISIQGKKFTLINIYGPNKDTPEFYENIQQTITDSQNNIILAGDFNLILNPDVDCFDYMHVNNPKAREKVLTMINQCGLIDIYRELHFDQKIFTWRRKNTNKQARLDFFLITENIVTDVVDCKILPGYRTDHSAVFLHIDFGKFQKGNSYWKFNNSLLYDQDYVNQIKKLILDVKCQYASELQLYDLPIDEIPNEFIQFSINDQLFLEVLLMEIRGKSISYSSYLKKKNEKLEEKLLIDIQDLESNVSINHSELENKRKELNTIRNKKLEGVRIRSKAKWVDEGEKVTNYFCSLENRNFVSKCMSQLETHSGQMLNSQEEIIKETYLFYKKLYTTRTIDDFDLKNEFKDNIINILSDEERISIETPLTYSEFTSALKNLKNDKSPGSDGFSSNFYKFFWKDIGWFVVRSLNYGFSIGELSVTQRQGIITCIPKGDKDKKYLKNWRPISLLNTSYKLASACIANRIKPYLYTLINEDQTGFLSGRFIGENIRTIYDVMFYCEKENIPGILLLIDFEKAFDSVAWSFINKVLDFFNFGPNIIKWFNVFYTNSCSSVIINGHMSDWFTVQRGCRQGDPLSPYIFILCAEILAILIRNNKNIKGIKIGSEHFLITQYADDTSLFLDGSEKSLRNALNVLKLYARISGLGMNTEKTKVVWFGSMKNSTVRFCQEENLLWETHNFKVLGINFSINLQEMVEINYSINIEAIKKMFDSWSKRVLTPLGKIVVIKSLALSKLNYIISTLPNPPEALVKRLNHLFFTFLWSGKPDRIKRNILTQDYDNGGLRMVDIEKFIYSMKITWIRRSILEDKKYLTIFKVMYPFMKDFQSLGEEYISSKIGKITNPFWKDVFSNYKNFLSVLKPKSWTQFLSQPLWYNNDIKVGGSCVFFKTWYKCGVRFVSDLFDENGDVFTYENFVQVYGVRTNFLDFRSVINATKQYLLDSNLNISQCNLSAPVLPLTLWFILKCRKGCRDIYDILIYKDIQSSAFLKWQNNILLPASFKWNDLIQQVRKYTKDTTLIWFQTRIIYRTIATNTLLQKINIMADNTCSFGCGEQETIVHLFYDCIFVESFWTGLVSYINQKSSLNIQMFTNTEILFGKKHADTVLNKILLQAKWYIYKCRGRKLQPRINSFKKEIINLYNVERINSYKKNCQSQFFHAWESYKSLICNEIGQ